jgi:hypothetical protein
MAARINDMTLDYQKTVVATTVRSGGFYYYSGVRVGGHPMSTSYGDSDC